MVLPNYGLPIEEKIIAVLFSSKEAIEFFERQVTQLFTTVGINISFTDRNGELFLGQEILTKGFYLYHLFSQETFTKNLL